MNKVSIRKSSLAKLHDILGIKSFMSLYFRFEVSGVSAMKGRQRRQTYLNVKCKISRGAFYMVFGSALAC